MTQKGLAGRLSEAVKNVLGVGLPVRCRVWDGSAAGPGDGPVLVIRSPRAIRYMVSRPGELGLVRAYVAGEIDIEGDFRAGLERCREFLRGGRSRAVPPAARWPGLIALLVRLGVLGFPPAKPVEEAKPRGRRHTPARDRMVVAHHYDLGNDFFARILDPTMAYSCANWAPAGESDSLADAQRRKLDVVCRALGLHARARLLDVGCGWGSLMLHAAEHYGVRATGVTVSPSQHRFVQEQAAARGLGDLVDVRLQDYRDLSPDSFDAVASIEMGEHVGAKNYALYCRKLRDSLRPGGKIFLQQMSRNCGALGGGSFIESYIAPDMAMQPLLVTLGHLAGADLEIREVNSLREDYVRTIEAWSHRLDDAWDEILFHYGARRARIWRLYLAGSALAFAGNRMSVHQVIVERTAVRLTGENREGPPRFPAAGPAEGRAA